MYLGDDYKRFLSPQINRRDFILGWLSVRGVKTAVMPIDGHEHIYVVFPKEAYSPCFKIKTVIAHYDIFPGSPGANDNTSSVFALMNWAARLFKSGIQHNVRLIFTDGEEISSCGNQAASNASAAPETSGVAAISGAPATPAALAKLAASKNSEAPETHVASKKSEAPANASAAFKAPASRKKSVISQGAFGLANVFRRLNITDDDIYVFDCVGRGTVPVLSRSSVPGNLSGKFKNSFFELESRISQVLSSSSGGKFVSLPVPYSDNAGFLAHGIAAVAVTMLPVEEANEYMFNLVRFPYLEDFVMNHKIPPEVQKSFLEKMVPETWRKFHTPFDDFSSLTEESFALMEKILENLALLKIPC